MYQCVTYEIVVICDGCGKKASAQFHELGHRVFPTPEGWLDKYVASKDEAQKPSSKRWFEYPRRVYCSQECFERTGMVDAYTLKTVRYA